MTKPHATPPRSTVRARPRLPRGPKPSSGGTGIRPRPLEERAKPERPWLGDPPRGSQKEEPVPRASEASLPDESSPSVPSVAPKTFDPNTAKTVSVKEAAYRLNKHPDTIRAWLRAGRLRGWQPGGHACSILVSMASLEEVLAASEANCRRVTGSRPA